MIHHVIMVFAFKKHVTVMKDLLVSNAQIGFVTTIAPDMGHVTRNLEVVRVFRVGLMLIAP